MWEQRADFLRYAKKSGFGRKLDVPDWIIGGVRKFMVPRLSFSLVPSGRVRSTSPHAVPGLKGKSELKKLEVGNG